MITVTISINGEPIYTRTAVNITKKNVKLCQYQLDTGKVITHYRDSGAVELAKKMLDTIMEVESYASPPTDKSVGIRSKRTL